MTRNGDVRSAVKLLEQFNRRFYVLNKTHVHGWEIFRIHYNSTQPYFTFWRGCETSRRVRRVSTLCHTIEIDDRPALIVQNFDIQRTGNIDIKVIDTASNIYFNKTTFLMTSMNMQRFMFQIFCINQTQKRLLAQINAIPPGTSKLPIPDAYEFTVDIAEAENDREIELALIFSVIVSEMRDYRITEDDNKEDFYHDD